MPIIRLGEQCACKFSKKLNYFSRGLGLYPLSSLAIRLLLSWTSIACAVVSSPHRSSICYERISCIRYQASLCVRARERQMSLQSQASSIAVTDCCWPASTERRPKSSYILAHARPRGKISSTVRRRRASLWARPTSLGIANSGPLVSRAANEQPISVR